MCMITRISKYVAAGAVMAGIAVVACNYTKEAPKPGSSPSSNAIPGVKTDEPQVDPLSTSVAVLKANEPASGGGKTDHTMFGGTPGRNMVNLVDKDIPSSFKLDEVKKWEAKLGSRSYGGPIVSGGKVFIGTNNENPRNKRDLGKPTEDNPEGPALDKGILMCFNDTSGSFLWQAVHDKLANGNATDWPKEGLCSTSVVEGDRIYYISNRCTVVCADVNGFANGNQGIQTEKYKDKNDVDIIWEFDMIKELDVFPHNMSACSPLIVGDTIFVVTANGVDENHINIPSPEAPSFLALSKKDGKVKWKSNAPGKAIMHGQWSNPCYGVIKGVAQVIFPGGDGWLRGFNPETGVELWKFDANPKDSKYELGAKGTRSDFVATPVVYNEKIYIGNGQDPEHLDGVGHFWCLDVAGKTGDVSPELVTDATVDPPKTKPNPNSAVVWHYGGDEKRPFAKREHVFGRTMSTACIVDDILYVADLPGYLQCLDAKTGKKFWQYDLKSAIWGSPYYVDGKIFLGNEDGDLFVFKHEKTPAVMDEVEEASKQADEKAANKKAIEVRKAVEKRYRISKIAIDKPIRSTVIVANGVLYVMTEESLFAIQKK